jgi:hypothetical protein
MVVVVGTLLVGRDKKGCGTTSLPGENVISSTIS